MSKRDEQIARIQGLMTYGISSAPKKTPITESIEGPDGKVYAIIREGSKFYIKSATKGSELVAESFNYIGGFMNKKNNEFSSYNQASKNLELKVRSLNEAYGVNKTVELLNPDKKETLMVEMTDAMKASLARYRQIMNNAAGIMNESATISASNTGVPEAPKTTSFSPKLGEPFNNNAEAKLDKDLKATANDPEKQGEPFGDKEKTEDYKDAQYVPSGSVANQHPSGGKVVRVNEGCDYEETIEECDEWGSCGVPASGSVGEVGDDDPFTEIVSEDSPVGFADETTFGEGEEGEDADFDLDDIDTSLEDDETEDVDIDDIDTMDDDEIEDYDGDIEDLDADTTESDEIESLRQEVEELRNLVNSLMGEESAEMEDIDDYDEELDNSSEFEDNIEDEYESMDESHKYGYNLVESSVKLPFPIKIRTADLKERRIKYGLGRTLHDIMDAKGGTDNDKKLLGFINGRLYDILQCETELKACIANNYTDDDTWMEIIATMESNIQKLNKTVHSLSFLDSKETLAADRMLNSFRSLIDKYSRFYDENINPDVNTESDVEDEEYPETPDVDVDNIGFEDEVEPNEEDAWTQAANYNGSEDFEDFNGMDDMFDSVKPRKLNENGTKLNDFGKHPGYRKKVMSLPQTGADKEGNVRDWNDDSVYSEEPFGSKIGSSAPYEDAINKAVDSIMESLKKKL